MTPAAANFTVNEDWSTLVLGCPACDDDGRTIELPYGSTIRDLIAAASDHARTAHPAAARYGYACRGINETGY